MGTHHHGEKDFTKMTHGKIDDNLLSLIFTFYDGFGSNRTRKDISPKESTNGKSNSSVVHLLLLFFFPIY